DVDGADAEAHLAGVDAIEIDEPLQGAPQRRGVVPAGGLDRARRCEVRRRHSRFEKAGSPLEQGRFGAQPIEEDVTHIAAQPVMGNAEGSNKSWVVTCSQKACSFSSRASGALPAIKAALIAPIEIPAIQSGCRFASVRP